MSQSNPHNELVDSIEKWNFNNPLDRWYRQKYNIRFGSAEHREIEPINVRIEYEEDKLYNKVVKQISQDEDNVYVPGIGQYLNKHQEDEPNNEEIDDIYDKIDITQLKENEDGSISL